MTTPGITVRAMRLHDIESAMRLSTAEGWNQSAKDWTRFIDNPQNVCLLAESNGKVIATTTAMNYSNKVAWVAMVLVDNNYRGRGISKLLLTKMLDELEAVPSIKLDATPAGRQVYKKFGFADEYQVVRMTTAAMKDLGVRDSASMRVKETDIPEVIAFDEKIFGVNREPLITSLISEFPERAWMLKCNEQIAGIVLGRQGTRYHHIGPLLVSGTAEAKSLIAEAGKGLVNKPVVVDVPCDKQELVEWLRDIGFTKQREFTRMYRNGNGYAGMVDYHFLICGPEFG